MAGAIRVLDSSVVLAAMFAELSAADAEQWLLEGCISAVNLVEVIAKLSDRGSSARMIADGLAKLDLEVIPFDQVQAKKAGLLRSETRHLGLSLGDRACLALAAVLGRPAATTDRTWAKLDLGIAVEVVR